LDPQGLLLILSNNNRLSELTLYESSFISYFENDISSAINFKLKKFALFDHISSGLKLKEEFEARKWTKQQLKNVLKFLRTQDLRSFHLESCHAANLGKFIKPSVEILEVKNITGSEEELKIPDNNVRVLLTNFTSNQFFSKFPQLEVIFVKVLTREIFINFQNDRVKTINYEEKEELLEWIDGAVAETVTIEEMSKNEFIKLNCNIE
jgi:hypothetical protein